MSKREKNNKEAQPVKKRSRVLHFFLRFFCALLGFAVGGFLYIYNMLGGFMFVETPVVNEEDYSTIDFEELAGNGDTSSSWAEGGHTRVYVDPAHPIIQVDQKDPDVENILVFGVDSRGTDDVRCRSDAMMIVSIDRRNDTVKLTSLMRDIGVYIGDTDDTSSGSLDKLTHAYAYGGVGLMINTINRNFDLDIQRFVMLDFNSSANLIDLMGGVEIDVSPDEVRYANMTIQEQNAVTGSNAPLLTSSGRQTLSGVQAIGWSRIRYLDSDFVRTSRQREVAMALIQKMSTMDRLSQMAFLEDSAGIFETNMRQVDLMRIGLNALGGADNIQEYRCPADDVHYDVQDNPWMMILDMNDQRAKLHSFIWGE